MFILRQLGSIIGGVSLVCRTRTGLDPISYRPFDPLELMAAQSSRDVPKKHLLDVFQKYFDKLVTLTQNCTVTIATKAFSGKMIPFDVLNEIITNKTSQRDKASLLLATILTDLSVTPHKLFEFIDLLKGEDFFHTIAEEMTGMFLSHMCTK